jgi:hypothetical protein
MKTLTQNGNTYRLPGALNAFQQSFYIHLINWKWVHITREPGWARGNPYDAILPDNLAGQYPLLYPPIRPVLESHLQKFPFRIHKYFNHMASSQAANLNLFLPVLHSPNAAAILAVIKPDIARIATDHLDQGWRIEFWDEPFGNLGDKTDVSGTDSDIAIAYYNHQGEPCLWLIEHKLTEAEFTTCGGFKSKGRQPCHDCSQSFAAILSNKNTCYYHDVRGFHYWDITERNRDFFPGHVHHAQCPFQGGTNQLWRNQLLALSIEQDERQPYQQVTFSVVRHPGNSALDASLAEYRALIGDNPKFSVFTFRDVLDAVRALGSVELNQWADWYCGLYAIE